MDQNELITLAGVFFGGLIAGAIGYFKTKRPPVAQDSVLASIGLELGNKEQMKELVEAVKGVERAIRDDKQDELRDEIHDLMEELRRRER